MRNILVGVVFIVAITFGNFVAVNAWRGQVYLPVDDDRGPAAVRELKSYAAIDGRTLSQSVHGQLMLMASATIDPKHVLISLGNPLMRWAGTREFACAAVGQPGVFDHIEISFYGIGVMDHGEAPRITVSAPCRAGEEAGRLAVLRIPTVKTTRPDPGVEVRFENIPDAFPPTWTLDQVRFFRSEAGAFGGTPRDTELNLSAEYLRQPRANLLTFAWPKLTP